VAAILWQVAEDEDMYYCDVIGAESALEAARKFIAVLKADQVREIENNRAEYDALVRRGEIDPKAEPFDRSGYQCSVFLPSSVICIPQFDPTTYHDRSISSDRKYEAQAFNELWDLSRKVEVRL
jgi:curved DNA-binding protein CbpA